MASASIAPNTPAVPLGFAQVAAIAVKTAPATTPVALRTLLEPALLPRRLPRFRVEPPLRQAPCQRPRHRLVEARLPVLHRLPQALRAAAQALRLLRVLLLAMPTHGSPTPSSMPLAASSLL